MSNRKKIMWKNNSLLYAEHLNKMQESIQNNSAFLFEQIYGNTFGVINFKIDEVLLSSGVLSVSYIQCIFPDNSIFEYDSRTSGYELSLSLTEFSEDLYYTPKRFYLAKQKENIEEFKEIISESQEIIPICYVEQKMKITDMPSENTIPICEVFIRSGVYNCSEFQPPCLKIKKTSNCGSLISQLLINMRKNIINLKEKISIMDYSESVLHDKIFLRDLNHCLVMINFCYINEMHPFDVYKIICDSIGRLSWISMLMPNIPVYNHNNSYVVIGKSISLLQEIINSSRGNFEKIIMQRTIDCFECKIKECGEEEIFLVVEPNNQETRVWIENTVIASESYFEDFQSRRYPGIEREIVDNSNNSELIVKLNKISNYLIFNENLKIFVGSYLSINTVSLFFKKNS